MRRCSQTRLLQWNGQRRCLQPNGCGEGLQNVRGDLIRTDQRDLKCSAPVRKIYSLLTNRHAANFIKIYTILKLPRNAKGRILTITAPFFWRLKSIESDLIWTKQFSLVSPTATQKMQQKAEGTLASKSIGRTMVYSLESAALHQLAPGGLCIYTRANDS